MGELLQFPRRFALTEKYRDGALLVAVVDGQGEYRMAPRTFQYREALAFMHEAFENGGGDAEVQKQVDAAREEVPVEGTRGEERTDE